MADRKSSFSMLSVDEALCIVLKQTSLLSAVRVPIMNSLGHVLAEDVYANDDVPAFPTSIMDGYAVCAPFEPGCYSVQERILAGKDISVTLTDQSVVYITTGAKLPLGTNAVIKVEDTETVDPSCSVEKKVNIKVGAKVGSNVREIGSDMSKGEIVLSMGSLIGPAEVGLLATIGVTQVYCHRKPTVGVMSTGDELVDVHEIPTGSQIRDSNRAALLSALREDGISAIDLGIVRDQVARLETALLDAANRCDVVISSGGVSMGEADLVKPTLGRLGQIHFGRLNMKPGKPTTFATLPRTASGTGPSSGTVLSGHCLFFALPGNPVSCLVTKSLLVDPALRRLQGMAPRLCLHPEVTVYPNTSLALDTERPEYHRAVVSVDAGSGRLVASSTGGQRSSRLLSMKSANALLLLPTGSTPLPAGTPVQALLLRPLSTPASTTTSPSPSMFPAAAALDLPPPPPPAAAAVTSTSMGDTPVSPLSGPFAQLYTEHGADWTRIPIRVALLTVSDRASAGKYEDKSGPEMARLVAAMPTQSPSAPWPCGVCVVASALVPDEPDKIQAQIRSWCDSSPPMADVVLTSGGTGFGPRDHTPEAVRTLLQREAPGVAQALLAEGLKHTPLAVLSRPVVGTRGPVLIATLPGSVKAVRENIAALEPLLPRIVQLLRSGSCEMSS